MNLSHLFVVLYNRSNKKYIKGGKQMSEKSDIKKLVLSAKKGNQQAFNALYNLTKNAVYYTCSSLLKNSADVQDICQEVYLTVFQKLNTLDNEEKFCGWVKQIAVNKCFNFKKRKVECQIDDEVLTNEVETNEVMLPEEYITNNAKREIILKLMEDTLSHAQYQTVFLFYFSEMSIPEIAEIMEVSEGTVKSRLNSSRAKIKTAVEKYEKENNDKLHGVVFVPLFVSIFKEEAKNITVPKISLDFLENPSAVGSSANGAGKLFKAVMSTAKTKAIAIACCATMVCGIATAVIICVGCNSEVPTSSATEETIIETVAPDVADTVKENNLKVDENGNITDSEGNKLEVNEKGEVEIATEDGKVVKVSSDEVKAVNSGSNVVVTTAPKNSNSGNTNTNKGNSNSNNSSTGKGNTNNSGSNGGSSSVKPAPKPTQKPADPHEGKTYHEAVTKKVWVEPEYKTVNHPAETKKVNHPAETRQVWVDPVTHEEPVYEWVGYYVCNQCGARLADANQLELHFLDSDTCVSYRTGKEKVQTGTKTVTDKEGYYKTETVKDAWTETVVVKEAWTEKILVKEGYYKTEVVREAGWY